MNFADFKVCIDRNIKHMPSNKLITRDIDQFTEVGVGIQET